MSTSTTPGLRPYQHHGISWIIRKLREPDTRAVFLCDDPGLGKTRQSLHACDALAAQRILILCPAGARSVWQREILRWFPAWADRLVVVEPGTTLPNTRTQLDSPCAVFVVGYDTIGTPTNLWAANLARVEWDILILDEAHYLKNPSQRTAAVYGLRGQTGGVQASCHRVILATGTLTPNHAGELYQHIRTFFPGVLAVSRAEGRPHTETEAEFQERFTSYKPTPWGRQITGSRNQAILKDRLGPFVLRRRKHDVLPELEPLIAQDVALILSEATLKSDLMGEVRQRSIGFRTTTDRDLLTRLSHAQQNDGPLASLRRELGELKVDAVAQWVIERLECGVNKMLVFGWHVRVLTHLHRLLAQFEPELITGATTPQDRRLAQERFQTRPETRVLVGQILACGTAITLTAANEVAIMEPSWVPAQNSQAIDRAHRLGQHDSVLASFLYVPGTLDERIMSVFRRKAEEVALIHDHPVNVQGNTHYGRADPHRDGPTRSRTDRHIAQHPSAF